MAFSNGFGGAVKVGSNSYHVENWSLDHQCEILDTTTTGDSGWQTNIAGVKKGILTFKTFYDPTVNPFLTPYDFDPGNTATITLMIGSTGSTWVGTFRIGSAKFENPVKGVVTVEISGETTGALTLPS